VHVKEQTFFADTDSFMTVHHLVLRGSNFEIGRQLGELARERLGKSAKDFAGDPLLARARRLYYQRSYPIHWQRVRGLASALGLDPDDDRYDLTALIYNIDLPPTAPGCSVVYYPPSTTRTGHGYLSRNYDFSTGSVADIFRMPLPPEARAGMGPLMREPYVMEWYPEDGGYASLAMQNFDLLSGTLDGMNSAGLAVTIMADDEAIGELGPRLENHIGPFQAVGLHELQAMRFLLDTCETVDQAKQALLIEKQHYFFAPCHYLVADKAGNSFIYENSTGRNVQYVIDGQGQPQACTNFQIYKHPTPESRPTGPPTFETEAFWRYTTLTDRLAAHDGLFSPDEIRENNAAVNIQKVIDTVSGDAAPANIAANVQARTLWHCLYDQQAATVDFSFYLGEKEDADGRRTERRSNYLQFKLERN